MGFRQYDVVTGRFLQCDALMEAFPDLTPYQYSFNNPLGWHDPTGLAPEKDKRKDKVMNNLNLETWRRIREEESTNAAIFDRMHLFGEMLSRQAERNYTGYLWRSGQLAIYGFGGGGAGWYDKQACDKAAEDARLAKNNSQNGIPQEIYNDIKDDLAMIMECSNEGKDKKGKKPEYGFVIVKNKETGEYEAVNLTKGKVGSFSPDFSNIDENKYTIVGIAHSHPNTDQSVTPSDIGWYKLVGIYDVSGDDSKFSNDFIIFSTGNSGTSYAYINNKDKFNSWYKDHYNTFSGEFIQPNFSHESPKIDYHATFDNFYKSMEELLKGGSGIEYGKFKKK
jgi:hypothetical protein